MIPKTEIKDSIIHYFLLIFIGIFLIGIGLLSYIIYREQSLTNRIYPNVFVDKVNVGEKTKQEVELMLSKKHTNLDDVKLNVFYKNEQIATISAEELSLKSNRDEIVDRAYQVGRSSHMPSRIYQKLATLFNLVPYTFNTGTNYDKAYISDYINDVADNYNKPAKNALFAFEEGKVTSFSQHENGLEINTDLFEKNVDTALTSLDNKNNKEISIYVSDSLVKPEVTLSEANNLGIEELIGEGKSDYSHSDESRIHNLTLAAKRFNGTIIEKDKTFSFNEILGDVSPLTGYKPGYVILNGKTVLGDGGGICQISTTMFRAALNTGLPIEERHNHAYRVIYYENDQPPGLDATIYIPGVDLKVKNDTQGAILIETDIDEENKLVYFKLYGKKDNRKVELSTPVLSDQAPPPPAVTQDDPTMKKGQTKVVEHAIPGGKSTFSYKVTNEGQLTFEKTFVSWYRPWAQVTLVGTAD